MSSTKYLVRIQYFVLVNRITNSKNLQIFFHVGVVYWLVTNVKIIIYYFSKE